MIHTRIRAHLLPSLLLLGACSSGEEARIGSGTGGAIASGDLATGGAAAGGAASRGQSAGGTSSVAGGGAASSGGVVSGGANSGGAAGGANSGGAAGRGDLTTGGNGGSASAGGSGVGGEAAAASGGESGEEFSPCPSSDACKILPLGDSITVGVGSDSSGGGGYRVELFRLAVEAGRGITYVGGQMPNGPMMVDGQPFPRIHGGISGQVVDEIALRIPLPELDDAPHIILLHGGTNDLNFNPGGADGRMVNLVDKIIEEAPDSLLMVASIIPMSFYDVGPYNDSIANLVADRAEAGAHIIFVDQFEGFPMSELGDEVHPNPTGYARMASKWFQAIEPYLP